MKRVLKEHSGQSWQCLDPGCLVKNPASAKICAGCQLSRRIFGKPQPQSDLVSELVELTDDHHPKDQQDSKALRALKAAHDKLKNDCESLQKQVELQQSNSKKSGTFNQTIQEILSLRLSILKLKSNAESTELAQKDGRKEMCRNALKLAKKFLLLRPEIEANKEKVKITFDLYNASKEVYESILATDTAFAEIMKQTYDGSMAALYTKLVDFIRHFPFSELMQLEKLLDESCKELKFDAEAEIRQNQEHLQEDAILLEIDESLSNLSKNCRKAPKTVSQLVLETDATKKLNTLKGAMFCISSVLDPCNDLEGFENVIPDLDLFALDAKAALIELRDKIRPLALMTSDSLSLENEDFWRKMASLFCKIWKLVDGDLKTFQVNYKLGKRLRHLCSLPLEFPLVADFSAAISTQNVISSEDLDSAKPLEATEDVQNEDVDDDEDDLSGEFSDKLSTVIIPGDDDLIN